MAEAIEKSKREGLRPTVGARCVILAILALLVATRIPWPDATYYLGFVAALAVVGWMQLHFDRLGYQRVAVVALMLDAVILTIMMVAPNPFSDPEWPSAAVYKFSGWRHYFVSLAAATIEHSWRVVVAFGGWMACVWLVTAGAISQFGVQIPEITEQLNATLQSASLARVLDPNTVFWSACIADAVVIVLVAAILGVNAWRRNKLILEQAALIRERSNLSRHFAPSMVDMLATRDHPFGDVRSQNVVIVFADIVGFTPFAERVGPEETIGLLREFDAQIEEIIFRHNGSLDKFLGDSVIASFGVPDEGKDDRQRALRCVQDMVDIKLPHGLAVSAGAHYGAVVLGDVGSERRLEFATIGDTANVAARLEAATRKAGARALVSDACVPDRDKVGALEFVGPIDLRRPSETINVWRII